MIGRAAAFAPGHITGFFEICDEADDPARIGSRGAGFSVRLGATSEVAIDETGFPGILVTVDGEPQAAETTRSAVELLLGKEPLHVNVRQTLGLPVSQGFGMSAAGALSAALATAEILGRARREAVWAAHCAEVVQRTGLGDVVGSALGGFERRLEPGVEPHGRIERFHGGEPTDEVLLGVVDDAIRTSRVLTDPAARTAINQAGAETLRRFAEAPGLRTFADLSREFSIRTRLASERIVGVYRELEGVALAGQCMLGGSVFAFGASPEVRKRLARHGPVFATRIDFDGARAMGG